MAMSNTLAYYDTAMIMVAEVLQYRPLTIKLFTAAFSPYLNKLECLPLPFTSTLVLYLRARLGAYHWSGVP